MNSIGSKLLIRLPSSLHAKLKAGAVACQTSLNSFCLDLMATGLETRPMSLSPVLGDLAAILDSPIAARLEAVILFGSRARGEAWQGSDTDLLLCLPSGAQLNRDLYRQWDEFVDRRASGIARSTSPHFAVLPEAVDMAGSLWFEVAIDGIVLWDRRLAVSRFLGRVRRYLLDGKAVRKATYGVPYWVRTDAKPQAG